MTGKDEQCIEQLLAGICQDSIVKFRSMARMLRATGKSALAAKADAYAEEQMRILTGMCAREESKQGKVA